MDTLILKNSILSVAAVVIIYSLSYLLKREAKKIQKKRNIKKTRYLAVKRLISVFSGILLISILIFIWGLNVRSLWISIAGILAMIAVAFFAVWSLVGNILAGFIIFFASPFKINDVIEVLPDGITGRVLAINSFYTVIADDQDNYINIPNSIFFQKFIRTLKKK